MTTTHQKKKTSIGITEKNRQSVAPVLSKLQADKYIILRTHEKLARMSKEQICLENIRFFLESA